MTPYVASPAPITLSTPSAIRGKRHECTLHEPTSRDSAAAWVSYSMTFACPRAVFM